MANETHQQSATMADVIIQNSLFKNGQFPNQLNYLGCDNNFKGEMTYENLEKVTPKIIAYKQFPNHINAYEIYPFFVYHSPGNKNESIPDRLNMDQLMYLSGKKSLDSGTKFIDLTLTNNYQLGLLNNYYRLGILLFDLIENGSYTNLIYNNTDEHPACWQIYIPLTDESTIHKSYSLPEILSHFGYTTPEDKNEIWQKICGLDGTPRCLIIGLYQYVQNEINTIFLGNYDTILKSCKIKIHYTNYQLTDDNQNNYEKQVNELITVKDVSSLNNTSLSDSSTYISVPVNYISEIYHDIPHIQLEKDPNEIHIYDYYRNYLTNYDSFANALDNDTSEGVIRSDQLLPAYKDCLENSFYFDNIKIKTVTKNSETGYEITLNICQSQKDFPIQKYQFFSEELSNNLDISIYCHFILSYWNGSHSANYNELMPLGSSCTLAARPLTYNISTNLITNTSIFIPVKYNKWVGRFSDKTLSSGKLSLYVIPYQISTRQDEGNTAARLGDSNVYYHKIVYNPDIIK